MRVRTARWGDGRTGIGLTAASGKASEFRLSSAARSVAALTTVQVVIHYRAYSRLPISTIKSKKHRNESGAFLLVEIGGLEPSTSRM